MSQTKNCAGYVLTIMISDYVKEKEVAHNRHLIRCSKPITLAKLQPIVNGPKLWNTVDLSYETSACMAARKHNIRAPSHSIYLTDELEITWWQYRWTQPLVIQQVMNGRMVHSTIQDNSYLNLTSWRCSSQYVGWLVADIESCKGFFCICWGSNRPYSYVWIWATTF